MIFVWENYFTDVLPMLIFLYSSKKSKSMIEQNVCQRYIPTLKTLHKYVQCSFVAGVGTSYIAFCHSKSNRI